MKSFMSPLSPMRGVITDLRDAELPGPVNVYHLRKDGRRGRFLREEEPTIFQEFIPKARYTIKGTNREVRIFRLQGE